MQKIYKKALYGLKQAPRAWYGRIDSFSTSLGFTKSKVDPKIYMNIMDDKHRDMVFHLIDMSHNISNKLMSRIRC